MHQAASKHAPERRILINNGHLEVRARMEADALTVSILKGGACVHRVVVDDASKALEHGWIVDLFAREERVELAQLDREAHDYLSELDIKQG